MYKCNLHRTKSVCHRSKIVQIKIKYGEKVNSGTKHYKQDVCKHSVIMLSTTVFQTRRCHALLNCTVYFVMVTNKTLNE